MLIGSVTAGPKRTRHGRIAVPSGPPGETATGIDGARVIACISGSGGVPAPVRNQVGASGTATRWPARTHVDRSRALSEIAPRRRDNPLTNGAVGAPMTRSPAAGRALHRDAECRRLEDAEAAVHDEHRAAAGRYVLLAGDVDADERTYERRGRDRRAADRDRTGRPGSGRRTDGATRANQRLGAGEVLDVEPVVVAALGKVAVAHATASRAVWIGTTSAHSNSSRSTCWVDLQVRETERTDRATRRAGASVAQQLDHMRRDRGTRDLADTRGARSRTAGSTGKRNAAAEARGLPRRRRARADDVQRAVVATLDRRDHRLGRVVGMQQRERRIGERGHRHRPAAGAGGRAGSARANPPPARSATRTRRRRRGGRARRPRSPRLAAATFRTGSRGAGMTLFVGNRRVDGTRAVHLEAAADDDVLEVARARRRAQRGDRAELGAFDRGSGRHARRRLVHTEVRDDVRRDIFDELARACRGRADRCGGTRPGAVAGGAGRSRRRRSRRPTVFCSRSCATRVPSSPPIPVIEDLHESSPAGPPSACSSGSRRLLRAQVREQDHLADRA